MPRWLVAQRWTGAFRLPRAALTTVEAMSSPEAQAHEDALRSRRDHPPEPPAGLGTMEVVRLAADLFASWSTDAGTLVDEVVAGGPRALWVDTEGVDDTKVLLYLHGGGYILGTADHVVGMVGHIGKAARCRVLSVDYRLAPEYPFPAALDDAVAAYRWLLDHDYGPADIVIGGDSAGGGLTLALLTSLAAEGLPQPAGAIPISPWADLSCSGESWETNRHTDMLLERERLAGIGRLYSGETPVDDPRVSPVHADYRGVAPLYIQASERETLLDDGIDVVRAAAKAGVDVRLDVFPGMQHVFQYCAGAMPEADAAIAELAAWVRSALGLD